MNITNQKVRHPKFGIGTITEQTETTVTVQFIDISGVKKFLYPSAFESFLSLNDSGLQKKIKSELEKLRKQEEEERKRREEENRRLREERLKALREAPKRTGRKRAAAKRTSKSNDDDNEEA